MASRLPRIAPIVIDRMRVQAWLEFHARTAVRFVCAPAGSGKTTCAVLYARSRAGRAVFVSPPAGTTDALLVAAIADAAACGPVANYAELVERLSERAPIEIIVDDCDGLAPGARALLGEIYRDVPDGVTFVYLARAVDAIAFPQGRAQGLVDTCDPALFDFDVAEIARFTASLGRHDEPAHLARLHELTHGWAIAVAGVCRTAAGNGLRLPDAFRSWCRLNDAAIREVVADAVSRVPLDVRAAFEDALAACDADDVARLERLRRAGLFVHEWNGGLALNPLVRPERRAIAAAPPEAAACVAHIEMFGRFSLTIGGRPVVWIRRRDRQIVQFLATRPHGRATRAEIIAAFWPDADRQLAGQSLRSACSTIRRAIADCVGRERVAAYFVGDHSLELNLDNLTVSSRQFVETVDLAEAAYARDDAGEAFSLFRAAEVLYRAPFLAGEPPAAWAEPFEAAFATAIVHVSARLDELSARLQSAETARRMSRTTLQRVSA